MALETKNITIMGQPTPRQDEPSENVKLFTAQSAQVCDRLIPEQALGKARSPHGTPQERTQRLKREGTAPGGGSRLLSISQGRVNGLWKPLHPPDSPSHPLSPQRDETTTHLSPPLLGQNGRGTASRALKYSAGHAGKEGGA